MKRLFDFLNKKVSVKLSFWAIASLPVLFYFVWELYWYSKVGLRFIRWHTHIALYVFAWGILFLITLFIGQKKPEKAKNILLVINSIFLILLIFEFFLIFSGITKTYMEKVTGSYVSPYETQNSSHYHIWSPNTDEHWLEKPEYKYWRPTNSLGYPDRNWEIIKPENEKRVLALGDSFTEGDGAPYDSSYVAILSNIVNSENDSIQFMNAGVCGSDPFFDFKALKDKLIIYQPDVILQSISSQDLLTDIIIRGGYERFKNKSLKFNDSPWWEPIYAINYTIRFYFISLGYSELLRKKHTTEEEESYLNEQLINLFDDYIHFCNKNNIQLKLILRPDKGEVHYNQYGFDFTEIISYLKTHENVQFVDLMPLYKNYIAKSKTDLEHYFWAKDGHHNSRGYEMMAKCIHEAIEL